MSPRTRNPRSHAPPPDRQQHTSQVQRERRQDSRGPQPPHSRATSIATWTVVALNRPVSWASRTRWSSQPRPLRGMDPSQVPPPFRGLTLEDRHPADPPIALTEDERRLLCPVCGVPELHRSAHRRGPLHRAKVEGLREARSTGSDVAAAVAVLQRHRPDLLRGPQGPPAIPDDVVLDMPDV
ncbi:uncharacterized protein LOC135378938 [Ornithodoros turicata]|uniref:uncharacterized protein LOC135378938 n=1 Tax=Ornithodoros turicata TaxID=34597 RepID=UPI0031399373